MKNKSTELQALLYGSLGSANEQPKEDGVRLQSVKAWPSLRRLG